MRARMAMAALGAAALLACACACACACAVPGCASAEGRAAPERTAGAASALQGGQVDPLHPFAVGVCGVATGPGQCQLVCSGTLLAPNLVLTARHCVDDATSHADCATASWTGHLYTSPDQYYVTTSKDLYQSTAGWHRVAAIQTPDTTELCGGDLALLVLGDVVAASEATPATPAIQVPLTDRAEYPSLTAAALGYGTTSPDTNTEGTRHLRTGIAIQCLPGDAKIDCDPKLAFGGSAKEFLTGDGVCDGDSGSGAFEQALFDKGSFVVLGALSRAGTSVDGKSCIAGVYTRLDVWRDFIAGAAIQAALRGAYPAPAWTVPVTAADGGATDGGPHGSAMPGHGCAVSGAPHSPRSPSSRGATGLGLMLGLILGWFGLRNSSRNRTQFRRAVGKKTG